MTNIRSFYMFSFCLLPFLAMTMSCAEETNNLTTQVVENETEQGVVSNDGKIQRPYTDFNKFHKDFSSAVDRSDWRYLAELTRFPFILKGELDDEGHVIFDKNKFIKSIGELLTEEIYLNIDDELVETNYRKIISNSKQQPYADSDDIQLYGMLFRKQSDGWKLAEITTHVHIIEKYLEE